jgi:hypothetical protein
MKNMVLASINGTMETATKATGKMERSMAKAPTLKLQTMSGIVLSIRAIMLTIKNTVEA